MNEMMTSKQIKRLVCLPAGVAYRRLAHSDEVSRIGLRDGDRAMGWVVRALRTAFTTDPLVGLFMFPDNGEVVVRTGGSSTIGAFTAEKYKELQEVLVRSGLLTVDEARGDGPLALWLGRLEVCR